MKSKVIVFLVSGMLATSSWAAEKQRGGKEESVGVGGGAAIGAIAGGPVGLIVGAALGGWLGDRFHHERGARRLADQRYEESSARAQSLETRLAASERTVAQKESELFSERVAHRHDLEDALSVEVFFRTEDSGVGGSAEERLAKLASLIEPMDGAVIHLEGHADARGTEAFNAALSTARAEAVRDALVRAGMPPERIIVTATGETGSIAAEQDADGMALERRVQMNIVDLDDTSRVAQQSSE